MTLLKAISGLTLAIALSAAPASPRELLADLANALARDDPESFLRSFDVRLRDELRNDITGLCARYDITSSIEVLEEKDAELSVDWFLELKARNGTLELVRRREKLSVTFSRDKERWAIKSLSSRALFQP